MLENRIQNEADKLISFIKRFWDDKVSNIKITDIADKPFDIFTLAMKLYKKFDIMMEYERSTLAISVKIDDEFVYLDELTDEPIFIGFESYYPENLLFNFKLLDKVLKSM